MSMQDDARRMPEPKPDPLIHDATPAGDPAERELPEEAGDASGPQEDAVGAPLTAEEARVLGCLMEKAQTTPEYYPLTMNALVSACNQKSNRDPVVSYDDDQVEEAVAGLRRKRYAARIAVAGSRVPKFKHTLDLALPALEARGMALLTVLLLRGAQTVGELRTRTERMFHFADLEAATAALAELENYPGRVLVRHLPAGGGRRVPTYVHLLCGEVEAGPVTVMAPAAGAAPVAAGWREELEGQVAALREEVATLREELDEFRAQFS